MPYSGPSDTAEAQADAMTAALAAMTAEVAAMRKALLGSERTLIEECLPRLEQAARAFQGAFQCLEHTAAPPKQKKTSCASLRRDLAALRGDLAVVAGLSQSGAALYQGLARLLGAAAGGYTPQGDGAPLRTSVSVLVRG